MESTSIDPPSTPEGRAFADLARKLVRIPKHEADEVEERTRAQAPAQNDRKPRQVKK